MLYFYVESKENVISGISEDGFDSSRLYRSLDQALLDKRGKVFVLDSRKTPARLSGDVRHIPRKAFLNVTPYLKPKEVAAGGGILTKQGKKKLKVLLICRKGVWDIAKGKQDEGESVKQCAKREVMEEVGIDRLKVHDFLDTTTHGYVSDNGKHYMVKTTFWYHMTTRETEFVPQASEKITGVKWFSIDKAQRVLGHKSLVRLLGRIEHKLHHTQIST